MPKHKFPDNNTRYNIVKHKFFKFIAKSYY